MQIAVYTHRRSTGDIVRWIEYMVSYGFGSEAHRHMEGGLQPARDFRPALRRAALAECQRHGIMHAEALIMLIRVAGIALALVCAGAARNKDNDKPAEARGENESVTITATVYAKPDAVK